MKNIKTKFLGLAATGLALSINSAHAAANADVTAAVTDVEDTVAVVVTALVTLLVTFLGIAFIKRIKRA